MQPEPLDKTGFTDAGHTGNADPYRLADKRRQLRQQLGGDVLVIGIGRFQERDRLRQRPAIAAHDAVDWAQRQVEIELNGVGDNPIFFPEDKLTLTGANFQGTPVSLPMEGVGTAIAMISVLSERRLNRLLHPALSAGLPAFLTKGAGMFSGMMLSQYTADSLIVEQRMLSAPAAVASIPAAADQEDFVSMGMTTALKTAQIIDHAAGVIGIELLCAAQALDFLGADQQSPRTRPVYEAIRERSAHMEEDRPLYDDINALADLVHPGAAHLGTSEPRR